MDRRKIHIGTSGWTYADWQGRFYPEDVTGADRLSFYAKRFDTVEVNSTFYRIPFKGMITAWNRRLGPRFHLVVKGPRAVTHLKKIKDCDAPLGAFLDRVMELRRLKVILWQLPPSLHKDVGRLGEFLSMLPENVRHAVEFRHESWWDDSVAGLLSRHNAAFAAVSHPTLPDTVFPTADFLYVRFHGLGEKLYSYDYSEKELAGWVSRLEPLLSGKRLYAFFNNDYNAFAPKNAEIFRKLFLTG